MKFNSEIYGKVYHPQETPARQADGFIKKPEPKQEPEKKDPEPEKKYPEPEPEKTDPEPEPEKTDPEPELGNEGGD